MITKQQNVYVYTNSKSINIIVSDTIENKTRIIGGNIRPDITITTKSSSSYSANIYEIKPSTQEGTGIGDAQLQNYVNTFNSYSKISAQKGGFVELDSKLGIQNTHTTTYNGIDVSYHYSGNGMIYYDAPWDDKVVEPVTATTVEIEYNKVKNTELITTEILFTTVITTFIIVLDKFLPSGLSSLSY